MTMTTNQTIDGVPRELLVRLCNLYAVGWEDIGPEIKELRALLDAPAKCEICDGSWRLGMGLCECFDMPASQPQGEPVACLQHRGEPCQCVPCKPAPVSVVLPERRTQDGWQSLTSQDLGWNACIDEVTRLNGGA